MSIMNDNKDGQLAIEKKFPSRSLSVVEMDVRRTGWLNDENHFFN